MKKIKLVIAFTSFVITSLMGLTNVVAQDDGSESIARMYYIEVIKGQRQQFIAGWRAYRGCLDANGGGNFSYNALEPESGKLAGILFRTSGHNWADFDAADTAAETCNSVFQGSFLPHIREVYSRFTQRIPYESPAIEGEVNIITLIDFDVESVSDAIEMIKEFESTANADGARGINWERNITSFDNWDLRVAILRPDYADMAPDGPGFWQRQAAHHGAEKAAALRERWQANLNKVNNRIWRRMRGLDYSPSSD